MKAAVDTGLKAANAPIEWATIADGIVYTAQIPMKADGSIETGDIATQTELTLANLRQTVEAAGGTMADVTQVLVYLPDPADFPGMNEVYRTQPQRRVPPPLGHLTPSDCRVGRKTEGGDQRPQRLVGHLMRVTKGIRVMDLDADDPGELLVGSAVAHATAEPAPGERRLR